jgi:hypothetical protein
MPTFSNIFVWGDWEDYNDIEIYTDCVILIKVGDYESGYLFDTIEFHVDELELDFYVGDECVMTKKLGIID